MPFSSIGFRPAALARFPETAPALGRHSFRDPRGRFRRATPEEAYAQDIAEGRTLTQRRGERIGVFAGRTTTRPFAIRDSAALPLDAERIRATINGASVAAIQTLLHQLVLTSPVDTGLLRSQWRAVPGGVTNRVPYVSDTEYINRSSRGYIRRAIAYTLHRVQLPYEQRTGGIIRPGRPTQILRF